MDPSRVTDFHQFEANPFDCHVAFSSYSLSFILANAVQGRNKKTRGGIVRLMVQKEIRGEKTSWYGKYPIIYGVLYIPGCLGFLNHQQYEGLRVWMLTILTSDL